MKNVTDLAPYQAVVAGSAIQGQKWLPEAMQFMRAHQSDFRKNALPPLWCVSLFQCPTRTSINETGKGHFARSELQQHR